MDRIINQSTWPRKEIFDFFSGISNPFYAVTFRQDVTGLKCFCREHGISFYYALVYLCCKALEDVPAFSLRIRGENVVELDRQIPSFTDLKQGSELFHIVTMPCEGSIVEFCRRAKAVSSSQNYFIDQAGQGDNLIYFSCLPWMETTAVTNERDLAAKDAKDDSIPRLCWGKYAQENGRVYLGMSVEVNHRLIDGVHIGRFAEALDRRIRELGRKAE